MNTIHPMETHDIGSVDDRMGCVVGGKAVDEDFNRCILPPKNPRKQDQPPSTRRESQTQGKHVKRRSKCGEVGHYKNTCRNPRADFDADYKGDVVAFDDLLGGNYPHCSSKKCSSELKLGTEKGPPYVMVFGSSGGCESKMHLL